MYENFWMCNDGTIYNVEHYRDGTPCFVLQSTIGQWVRSDVTLADLQADKECGLVSRHVAMTACLKQAREKAHAT